MKFKASVEQANGTKAPVPALMACLLHSVTGAHILHLQSRSYSEHQALGAYYSGVGDLADAFIEAYQGKYSIIDNYPSEYVSPAGGAIAYLQYLEAEVETLRRADGFPQDSELQNEVDNIANLINSTLYKLRFLK
jgi:hypothetical protein